MVEFLQKYWKVVFWPVQLDQPLLAASLHEAGQGAFIIFF